MDPERILADDHRAGEFMATANEQELRPAAFGVQYEGPMSNLDDRFLNMLFDQFLEKLRLELPYVTFKEIHMYGCTCELEE